MGILWHCGSSQHYTDPDPNLCEHQIEVVGPHCVKCGQGFSDKHKPLWVGLLVTFAGLVVAGVCCYLMGNSRDKGVARLASHLLLPALALLAYGAKLLIPDSK